MNAEQMRELVVRPTLRAIGLDGRAAENLVLGTFATESHFEYVKQVRGPALGLGQMEPFTLNDLVHRWLRPKNDLRRDIARALGYDLVQAEFEWLCERMCSDMGLMVVTTRLRYRMAPDPMPVPHEVKALGEYWKKIYNTPLGKGTVPKFMADYARYVGEV